MWREMQLDGGRCEHNLYYTAQYTYLRMASKNLAIREEVYRKLSEAKKEGESFSDVIEKLLEKRGDLLSLWGAWGDDEEVAFIETSVKEARKRSVIRTR